MGTAFRVPDIKELYVTTNTPGGLNNSNPDLVPEESMNIDLSFQYLTENTSLELGMFRNQINNMIVLDWDNTTANREGTFKNIGEGLLYGAEFLASQQINKQLSVYANLTKIYGFDVHADDELMDVPPLQLNAGITYRPVKTLSATLSGRYSAKQDEVAEDDIANDAFFTTDFSAVWYVLDNLKLNFSVSNILNEEYREHYQFDWMYVPSRSFNLGLNFNF
jgi:outer membrane receptor protein involved in Fe transport